jgi:hypothetical protein
MILRLRLHAQGVPAGGPGAGRAVRRDAPVHPGFGQLERGEDRRVRGQPPAPDRGQGQVRPETDGQGAAGPDDRQVPRIVLHQADLRLAASACAPRCWRFSACGW